jgi:hypothetical protein
VVGQLCLRASWRGVDVDMGLVTGLGRLVGGVDLGVEAPLRRLGAIVCGAWNLGVRAIAVSALGLWKPLLYFVVAEGLRC